MKCRSLLVLVALLFLSCGSVTEDNWDWRSGLRLPDRTAFAASELAERVVVLVFWSPWATPCEPLLEEVAGLARGWPEDEVRVLAVVAEHDGEEKREEIHGLDVVVPASDSIVRFFGIEVLPTVVVLDRSGGIAGRFEGFGPGQAALVEEAVKGLLKDEQTP